MIETFITGSALQTKIVSTTYNNKATVSAKLHDKEKTLSVQFIHAYAGKNHAHANKCTLLIDIAELSH